MYKLKRWCTKPLFFVALFLSLSIGSIVSTPTPASAATQDVPDLLFNQDVYSGLSAHQHYWWLYACFSDANIDNIEKDEMASWDIFEGVGANQYLGGMYDSEGGRRDCENEGIVKTAFNYLGATDPAAAYCSLAKTFWDGDKNYYDDETCRAAPGDGTWDMDGSTGEQAATFKANFESKKPPLTAAAEYMRAYSTFMQGCDVTLGDTLYDTSGAVPGADGDNIYAVPVVVEDGTDNFVVKYKRGVGVGGGTKVYLVSNSDSTGGATERTCNQLVNLARDNAGAYAAYLKINGYDTDTGSGTVGGTEAVCSAGALGWIFCPLTDFISTATTKTAELLEGQLIFRPLDSEQGRAIQAIWGVVLGVANVGLVIAFLIVIFSQATSVGLSKYGIKKILPRIIAAAILMNLSFYICAAAVDIFNILGVSVKTIIDAGMSQIGGSQTDVSIQDGSSFAQGLTAVILVLMAAIAGSAIGLLPLLLPILLSALFAVVTAFIILAVRQVLIMLLIIVAPLAFLAWILPNTEEWFTKWRKLFTAMLVMFPIVMGIFYGSLLVSKVILATGNPGGDGDPNFMTNLIALVVLTVPLFSLPFIMRTAGGVLERFGVLVNNRNKGIVDRSRKYSAGASQRQREKNMARMAGAEWGKNQNGLRGGFKKGAAKGARFAGGYTARRDFKRSSIKSDADRIQQNAIADQLQDKDSKLAAHSTLRGDTGQAIARARGIQIQDKAIGEEVSAAKTVIENMQFTNAQLRELATKGSAANISGQGLTGDFYQKAAQQQFISTGQTAAVHDILNNSDGMSEDVRGTLAYHLQQNYSTLKAKDHTLNFDQIKEQLIKGNPVYDIDTGQKDAKGNAILRSTTLEKGAVENLSGLTKEVMSGQDAKGLSQLRLAIANGTGDAGKRAKAISVIQETMSDPLLKKNMTQDSEKEFAAILSAAGVQATAGAQGQVIVPRTSPTQTTPPTQVQQQRQAGGNFSNGPGQTPPTPPGGSNPPGSP